MQKPDDIPEDIWAAAIAAEREANEAYRDGIADPFVSVDQLEATGVLIIARAILAERERCLAIMNMKMPVVLGPNDWTNYVVGPLPEELLRSKV